MDNMVSFGKWCRVIPAPLVVVVVFSIAKNSAATKLFQALPDVVADAVSNLFKGYWDKAGRHPRKITQTRPASSD